MGEIDWGVVFGIIGGLSGLSGLIIGLLKLRPETKNIDADTKTKEATVADKIVLSAGNLVDNYEEFMAKIKADKEEQKILYDSKILELRGEIDSCRTQFKSELDVVNTKVQKLTISNKRLLSGIAILISQMEEAGLSHRWQPDLEDVNLVNGIN